MKIELCIPLESETNVLSTSNDFICLSPPFRCAFLFYLQKAVFVQCYTVRRDFRPMTNDDLCHMTM